MIPLAPLAIKAGSFLTKALSSYYAKKGLDKIFETKENFKTELSSVINNSLEEYELRYNTPDSNGKYAFYKSQNVINELLKYRIISDEYDFNNFINVIENDKKILSPSEIQLEYFFEVFKKNIFNSGKLKKLEICLRRNKVDS